MLGAKTDTYLFLGEEKCGKFASGRNMCIRIVETENACENLVRKTRTRGSLGNKLWHSKMGSKSITLLSN